MTTSFFESLASQTEDLKAQGLYKTERLITGPQQADIDVQTNGDRQHVLGAGHAPVSAAGWPR